jgi:hypothetical protein
MPRMTITWSVLSLPLLLHSVRKGNLAFSLSFYGLFRNYVCVNYTERINVGWRVSDALGMLRKVAVVAYLEVVKGL